MLSKESLVYLLEQQDKLDATILENKQLEKKDTRKKREVAFLMEFSEFVNDTQYFKYWKEHNEPKETMAEEFVDALHFALSLMNDSLVKDYENTVELYDRYINMKSIKVLPKEDEDLTALVFRMYHSLTSEFRTDTFVTNFKTLYLLLKIGEKVGMTEEIILDAYEKKNKVNYQRQEEGY